MKPMCMHRPISNGWSGSESSPPVTWCGRCHEYVLIDAEWVERYYGRSPARDEDRRYLAELVARHS